MQEKKESMTKQNRMVNLDLLRNISMMLVVVLHFLSKGTVLPLLTDPEIPGYGYAAWFIETLAIVAVNVYMLLSGYFLVESSFNIKKVIRLVLTVLFYSIGIGVIAILCGWIPEGGFNIYTLTQLFLPISTNQYWFMTAYVFMYLFTPVLAIGVKKLSKKQFQVVLGLIIFTFCILKSFWPVTLATDQKGYDCIWYLCVFLVAAYIRLYGIPFFKSAISSIIIYLLAVGVTFGATFLYRFLYLKTGKFESMMSACYDYNHIFVLVASVAFFCFFCQIKIKNRVAINIISALAPYTLGVYLLHEHVAIRYLWPQWIFNLLGQADGRELWFLALPIAVILVFIAGIFVDKIRSLLFKGIYTLLCKLKPFRKWNEWAEGVK